MQTQTAQTQTPMRQIKIDKVTLNVGCGTDNKKMDKALLLLEQLSGVPPVKTKTNMRIATWGLRPGLPIGVKVTLRGTQAVELLKRCIAAKEKKLRPSMFDDNGNVSFGIHEYIDVPGAQYDPKIGIMGFQISVTLIRPGQRVARRKNKPTSIPKSHRISAEQAIEFMTQSFGVQVE